MKPGQRKALIFLFALPALLMGTLAVGYQRLPKPAVSVVIPVRIIEIDDAMLEQIGVDFDAPPATNGRPQ